jgi:hypothetical protein
MNVPLTLFIVCQQLLQNTLEIIKKKPSKIEIQKSIGFAETLVPLSVQCKTFPLNLLVRFAAQLFLLLINEYKIIIIITIIISPSTDSIESS